MLLLKRVGRAELQSLGEALVPGDLERVVSGTGDVVGFANGVVALVRPQGIQIHAGIGQNRSDGGLVDIGLALLVQTAASDIGHAHDGIQQISRSTVKFQFQASGFLNSRLCVVTVSGRAFAELPPGLSALPKLTLAVGWKGGLPPRKTESLTPRRVKKRPPPARITVFVIQLISDADARLELSPLNIGVVVG